MSKLLNSIYINASPKDVWSTLTQMDILHIYDPGVVKSSLLSPDIPMGLGSARQCDLKPKGWFREKVTEFSPEKKLSFELYDCTLPVQKLKHRYELIEENGGTLVRQEMDYSLKYGLLGRMLDVLIVSRQFDTGIKSFFAGLKNYVENEKNGPR